MRKRLFQILLTAAVSLICVASAQSQQANAGDKQIEVRIYLQKTLIDPSGATSDELSAVKRKVHANSPLRATLEALFTPGITPEEDKQNYYSSTFGMKFEGVSLKNGTALVRFSQPQEETNYGSAGPGILAYAIEQTAKQFPSVKLVKICAVGDTMIDSELEYPFPRCAKK